MSAVWYRSDGRELDLLDALDPDARADLGGRGRLRAFRPGSVLLYEGQLDAPVIGLVSGHARVSVLAGNGRDLVLAFRGPGAILGEIAALENTHCSATHTAIDEVRALVLGRADFNAFLEARPEVAISLLRMVGHRLRDGDRKRVEFAALDTPGRVAARLVELAERFGEPQADGSVLITLPLSQDELATWLGSSREATVRALAQLRQRGWLETARRRIRVVDMAALRTRSIPG